MCPTDTNVPNLTVVELGGSVHTGNKTNLTLTFNTSHSANQITKLLLRFKHTSNPSTCPTPTPELSQTHHLPSCRSRYSERPEVPQAMLRIDSQSDLFKT